MWSLIIFFGILPLIFAKTLYTDQADQLAQIYQLNQLEKIDLAPLRVSESDVSFRFYNRNDTEGTAVAYDQASNIISLTEFNDRLCTVFIIHGWMNNCNSSSVTTEIRKSLLTIQNVNVITVCWDGLANSDYLTSYLSVKGVGEYVGDFIRSLSETNGYDLQKIKVVGHSLGAHIAGYAGQENGGNLAYIIGLDPAGPLFFQNNKNGRLDQSDAKYVQVIHTNAGILGANYQLGHVDFWPNGGRDQPGCFLLDITCSHSRSYYYYAESIVNNRFVARKCSNYANYQNSKCTENTETHMGGYILDESITGYYYLDTAESSPYALGNTDL